MFNLPSMNFLPSCDAVPVMGRHAVERAILPADTGENCHQSLKRQTGAALESAPTDQPFCTEHLTGFLFATDGDSITLSLDQASLAPDRIERSSEPKYA